MKNQRKWSYFQFASEVECPVYIKVELDDFDSNLKTLLNENQFEQLKGDKVEEEVEKIIQDDPHARLLTILQATNRTSLKIGLQQDSDYFGSESVSPGQGYSMYRFKGHGLLVYSYASKYWELGVFSNFGHTSNIIPARMIFNRYLAWALAPLGYIGFWAEKSDKGILIKRPSDVEGRAVFVEARGDMVISPDGVEQRKGPLHFFRINKTLGNRSMLMSSEELLGFLSTHLTYIDHNGLSVPVRQMLQLVSQENVGTVIPNFEINPRSDLSL